MASEAPQGASLQLDKASVPPMVAERESAKRASRVRGAQDVPLQLCGKTIGKWCLNGSFFEGILWDEPFGVINRKLDIWFI